LVRGILDFSAVQDDLPNIIIFLYIYGHYFVFSEFFLREALIKPIKNKIEQYFFTIFQTAMLCDKTTVQDEISLPVEIIQ